jgi:hypothetical protein
MKAFIKLSLKSKGEVSWETEVEIGGKRAILGEKSFKTGSLQTRVSLLVGLEKSLLWFYDLYGSAVNSLEISIPVCVLALMINPVSRVSRSVKIIESFIKSNEIKIFYY